MGLWLVLDTAPAVYEDVRFITRGGATPEGSLLSLGQHGSELVMGGAWLAEGGLATASRFSRVVALGSRLQAVSRWAGTVGHLALAAYAGFTIWQWGAGHITDRQFYGQGAQLAGGLAGGVVGGWTGFKAGAGTGALIGVWFGPAGPPTGAVIGGAIGLIGGGLAGGYVGSSLSGYGVSSYFEFKDKEQEAAFAQFLRAHYERR